MTKEDKIRFDTMTRFRDMLKKDGAEKTLETIERYIGNGYLLQISPADYTRYENQVKNNVLDTVLIASLLVLHDKFGFGTERLNRFKKAFNTQAECLADDFVKWNDIQNILLDECNIETEIRGAVKGYEKE